jgi:CO dehydrogenase/acetyl-CoA synthase beta subunit
MLRAPDSAQSTYLPHFARPNRHTWPKTEDTNEDEEEEEEEEEEKEKRSIFDRKMASNDTMWTPFLQRKKLREKS